MDFRLIRELYFQRIKLNIVIPFVKLLLQNEIRNLTKLSNADNAADSFPKIQRDLLSSTVLSMGELSPAFNYKKEFVRLLHRALEEVIAQHNAGKRFQVISEFYEIYSDFIQRKTEQSINELFNRFNHYCLEDDQDNILPLMNDNSVGFCTYFVANQKIAICESNEIVSEGTTGFRTWPAAISLLNFVIKSVSRTDPGWNRPGWRSILELGSGTGLLGIGLLKCGFIEDGRYTFTDHSYSVLSRLRLNCFANKIPLNDSLGNPYRNLVDVQPVDWSNVSSSILSNNYDLIVASDVIFDFEAINYFIQALSVLFEAFRRLDTDRRFPDCLVCSGIRNTESRDYFFEKLVSNSFQIEIFCKLDQPEWSLKLGRVSKEAQFYGSEFDYSKISLTSADIVPIEIYRITPNQNFKMTSDMALIDI